jgi:TP901 family phage tail tape measure protein
MSNTLKVVLTGDASQLNSALTKTSARLKSFGTKAQAIGSKLSKSLTLPLTLAGGAGIKLAADFDKSMTKIESLVGIAGEEVAKMGETAKQMATDTGRSASEAADALFFITSAGLEGEQAMNVLNASLQAAAVGLGDTATVADLATSAMNAYGADTLGASDATDVLVAAVREGKLESSELAGAMGSVLPIASNMGVSFNEVGAAFAAMSRTGTNAAVASTQLRGILNGLLKPTKDAEDALAGMGLSSAGLRQSLKEDGLLATLEILKSNFEGNDQAAARVFGNVRALSGVMDLLGAGVDSTREIFAEMNNVQGATATAFERTSESASFKLDKAMVAVRNSLTEVGSVLLTALVPTIQSFTNFITNLTEKFNSLDESTKRTILTIAGIAAAAGPVIIFIGKIATGFGSILSILPGVTVAFKVLTTTMLANPILAVAAGVTALGLALSRYSKNQKDARREAMTSGKSIQQLNQIIAEEEQKLIDISNSKIKNKNQEYRKIKRRIAIYQEEVNTLKSVEQTQQDENNTVEEFNDILEKNTQLLSENTTEISNNQAQRAKVTSVTAIDDSGGITSKGIMSGLGEDTSTLSPIGFQGMSEFETSMTDSMIESSNQRMIQRNNEATNAAQNAEKIKASMERTAAINDQLGAAMIGGFAAIGEGFASMAGDSETAMGSFLSTLIQGALQFIAVNLAQSMSLGVTAAAQSAAAAGPFAAFVLPALIAGATAAIGGAFKKIPKFANGGIVSTPTLGMFGEYAGARQNPEVVAPLDRLTSMIQPRGAQQVDVGGSFQLRGQDLVVALQRAETNRGRIK